MINPSTILCFSRQEREGERPPKRDCTFQVATEKAENGRKGSKETGAGAPSSSSEDEEAELVEDEEDREEEPELEELEGEGGPPPDPPGGTLPC